MKLRVSIGVLSLFLTSHAAAEDQTDSLNMAGDVVKVIKKYNGRWKGWSDGCVNCDKPLTVTIHKKPKAPKKKAPEKTSKMTAFRAPIKQGYCECNCKPLKDIKDKKADASEDETPALLKPEKE